MTVQVLDALLEAVRFLLDEFEVDILDDIQ